MIMKYTVKPYGWGMFEIVDSKGLSQNGVLYASSKRAYFSLGVLMAELSLNLIFNR